MKSLISSIIARKMTIDIAILLVGITAFGVTAFGITDKTYAAESTLSLSIDNSAVKVDVAPTSIKGTFRKGTASTISASTNNATGYTLSISAPSASGSDYDKLINTADNTAKISSISSPTTEEQYKALNNTSYNNTWGYLPSKYCSDGTSSTCATNTDFLPAPTIAGDVLDQTTAANTTANTYTIGMGTRIDSNTKTGKYTNSFVVKLVANAIPYTMVFDDNVVSNMPTDRDTTSMTEQVSMPDNVPVRTGYKFLGWCTVVPTSSNGTDTCTGGTQYQPSATLTIDQTGTGNNFHFYAMWKELDNSLQGFAAGKAETTCSAMSTGDTLKLRDSRDNQEYAIGKLADGKCWMLDNLALDLTNDTILNGLTADNTNIDTTNDSGALVALKGTNPGTTSDKYATAKVANWTSSYSFSAPLVNLTNKDVIPQGEDPMASTVLAGEWKVGGYYNYCAASAGSYCYGDGTSYGTSSGDATSSICPKGWRMPTGNTGETTALYNAYSSGSPDQYTAFRTAFHLPLSGYFYSGSADSQGSDGYWWSSTRHNNNYMYNLSVYTSIIYPDDYFNRRNGISLRCILDS